MLEALSVVSHEGDPHGSDGGGDGGGDGPALLDLRPDSVVEARGCHFGVTVGVAMTTAVAHVADGAMLRLADDCSVEVQQPISSSGGSGGTAGEGGVGGGGGEPSTGGWRGAFVLERGGEVQAAPTVLWRVVGAPTPASRTTAVPETLTLPVPATPNAAAAAAAGSSAGSPNGGSASWHSRWQLPPQRPLSRWPWPFRGDADIYVGDQKVAGEGEAVLPGGRQDLRTNGGGGERDRHRRSLRGFYVVDGNTPLAGSPAAVGVAHGGGGSAFGTGKGAHWLSVEGASTTNSAGEPDAAVVGVGAGASAAGVSRGLLVECPEGYFGDGERVF